MRVEWLQEALQGSGWSVDEVLDGIEKGHFFLFQNEKAFGLMEFIISPRHKVAHVWAAGGEKNDGMSAYLELVPIMEEFGIKHGCDIAGGTGRKGWARAMQNMGYAASEPAIEKELVAWRD